MFYKRMFGVRSSTDNTYVYGELGHLPLIVSRKIRIFKYWLKVQSSNNIILQSCYNEMLDYDDAWVVYTCIRNELFNLGLGCIWN